MDTLSLSDAGHASAPLSLTAWISLLWNVQTPVLLPQARASLHALRVHTVPKDDAIGRLLAPESIVFQIVKLSFVAFYVSSSNPHEHAFVDSLSGL
jgi:hypothetical protein